MTQTIVSPFFKSQYKSLPCRKENNNNKKIGDRGFVKTSDEHITKVYKHLSKERMKRMTGVNNMTEKTHFFNMQIWT